MATSTATHGITATECAAVAKPRPCAEAGGGDSGPGAGKTAVLEIARRVSADTIVLPESGHCVSAVDSHEVQAPLSAEPKVNELFTTHTFELQTRARGTTGRHCPVRP